MMLGKAPKVGRVEDFTIPGPAGPIRARLTARGDPEKPGPVAGLVYFHGGGWVAGSIATHDHLCRAITNAAGVGGRLGRLPARPGTPVPGGRATTPRPRPNGCRRTPRRWGSTRSGWPSAATARGQPRGRRRPPGADQGGPRLAFQLLLYPITDADLNTPSYLDNAEGFFLTRAAMAWYWDQYVADPARRLRPRRLAAPRRGPLGTRPRAGRHGGLRPAARRGRGVREAARTRRVFRVRLSRYPGMIHGFLRRHAAFEQGKLALAEIAAEVGKALGSVRDERATTSARRAGVTTTGAESSTRGGRRA